MDGFFNILDGKVKTLMNPDDEENWRRMGLFDKVDELQKGPLGLAPSLTNPSHFSDVSCTPSSSARPLPSAVESDLPPLEDIWVKPSLLFSLDLQTLLLLLRDLGILKLRDSLSLFVVRSGKPTRRLNAWF
jgi:hypothetical protein